MTLEIALNNLKKDFLVEMKQHVFPQSDTHCTVGLAKSLKEQIEILFDELYFLQEEVKAKTIF